MNIPGQKPVDREKGRSLRTQLSPWGFLVFVAGVGVLSVVEASDVAKKVQERHQALGDYYQTLKEKSAGQKKPLSKKQRQDLYKNYVSDHDAALGKEIQGSIAERLQRNNITREPGEAILPSKQPSLVKTNRGESRKKPKREATRLDGSNIPLELEFGKNSQIKRTDRK